MEGLIAKLSPFFFLWVSTLRVEDIDPAIAPYFTQTEMMTYQNQTIWGPLWRHSGSWVSFHYLSSLYYNRLIFASTVESLLISLSRASHLWCFSDWLTDIAAARQIEWPITKTTGKKIISRDQGCMWKVGNSFSADGRDGLLTRRDFSFQKKTDLLSSK